MNTDLFKKYIMYYNQMHSVYLNKFVEKLKNIHDEIQNLNSESFSPKANTPYTPKQPAVVEKPIVVETPLVAETPVVVEKPTVEETPVVVETPKVVETPAVVEKPTVIETPVVDEKNEDKKEIINDEVAQEMAANIIEDTIKKIT